MPQFARVRYENVYPGINLVFYGNQGRLEYDFQVAPGSDPAQAELEFNGAKQLELKDGALVIRSEGGSVRLEAPRVYQEIAGRQQPVEGSFVLRGANRAGFAIGSYDHSRELVIDPILTFSTYFGGSGDEHSTSVAVDGSFQHLPDGFDHFAQSADGCGDLSADARSGAQNVYIAKITPPLGSLLRMLDYVTYLGGRRNRQSGRNQRRRRGRSIPGGHDFLDQLPHHRDQRLPNGSRSGQHRALRTYS